VNRRTLIKAMSYGAASVLGGHLSWRLAESWRAGYELPPLPEPGTEPPTLLAGAPPADPTADEGSGVSELAGAPHGDRNRPSYLEKIRDFDRSYSDDYLLEGVQLELLASAARRLTRVQRVFGHGNFNLLSFDGMLQVSRRYSSIGTFTRRELDFLEEVFFIDATEYGFYGDKVLTELTAEIAERETVKVEGTGHYLFRGGPQAKYEKMCKDLNGDIFLTSGIRGLVKQMQLFLDKAVTTDGNLSQASRSLAPPGYSYHAIGDFDIGKVGAGLDNFNDAFAETEEYKRLVDLGYAEFRYTPTNPFGVRHEPWHIKMKV